MSFFFNGTAPTEIYTYLHTLSLHNALPIWLEEARPDGRYHGSRGPGLRDDAAGAGQCHIFVTTRDAFRLYAVFTPRGSHPVPRRTPSRPPVRSEAHTSELQSLMRISYAVFCLKKKKKR